MSSTGLISSIKQQIEHIKAQISNGGLSDLIVAQLQRNQYRLEEWYNRLLNETGILTDAERQELEASLNSAKKDSLEAEAKRTKRKMTIVLVGAIVIVAGIIVYIKFKK